MELDYPDQVAALDSAGHRRFYETLALNLTVAARRILSDQFLDGDEKFEGLKWVNEVQHCVIQKLRDNSPPTDAEFFDLIWARAEVCDALTVPLNWAVRESVDHARGAEDLPDGSPS